jgi:uncharacterized protein (DUF4415 family)
MNIEDRVPLTDPSQVSSNMTEEQAREFWASHEVTEEYLKKAGPVPQEDLPEFRPRTKPVSVRLDADVLRRLKKLAELKNKGYQTLLKEFIAERLYEEERREGIIPGGEERNPVPKGFSRTRSFQTSALNPQSEGTRSSEEDLMQVIQNITRGARGTEGKRMSFRSSIRSSRHSN